MKKQKNEPLINNESPINIKQEVTLNIPPVSQTQTEETKQESSKKKSRFWQLITRSELLASLIVSLIVLIPIVIKAIHSIIIDVPTPENTPEISEEERNSEDGVGMVSEPSDIAEGWISVPSDVPTGSYYLPTESINENCLVLTEGISPFGWWEIYDYSWHSSVVCLKNGMISGLDIQNDGFSFAEFQEDSESNYLLIFHPSTKTSEISFTLELEEIEYGEGKSPRLFFGYGTPKEVSTGKFQLFYTNYNSSGVFSQFGTVTNQLVKGFTDEYRVSGPINISFDYSTPGKVSIYKNDVAVKELQLIDLSFSSFLIGWRVPEGGKLIFHVSDFHIIE